MGIRGYIDKQLTNDEEILYRAHISWIPVIFHTFPYMFVFSAIGGITWAFTNNIGLGLLVVLIGIFVAILGQTKKIIYNLGVDIVVTNKRLHTKRGIFKIKDERESSLSRIDDTDIDLNTIWQRLFKYGDIAIRTLSGSGSQGDDFFSFKKVARPHLLKQAINTTKDTYAGWGEPGRTNYPRARTEREVHNSEQNR